VCPEFLRILGLVTVLLTSQACLPGARGKLSRHRPIPARSGRTWPPEPSVKRKKVHLYLWGLLQQPPPQCSRRTAPPIHEGGSPLPRKGSYVAASVFT